MKAHIALSSLLLVTAGFQILGCRDSTRSVEADTEAIRALIESTEEMNRTGNADGWVSLFEDDAVYMPPGHPGTTTRAELMQMAESGFSQYVSEVDIRPDEIVVTDDWAFVRSTVQGVALPVVAGDTITVNMKQIAIYHRQLDGSWKIARLIGNSNG